MLYKTLNVKQIQKLDEAAIERFGIPSIVLMENAGRTVSNEIRRLLKTRSSKSACVICGVGQNGGDGFVAARHLINAGFCVSVYLIGSARQLKKDAKINYQILKNLKHPVREIKAFKESDLLSIRQADIVVDAIFGIGLNRTIESPFKDIIQSLNRESNRIVAVDIPSGLDGTTGKIHGVCIRASRTVSFSCAKQGFFLDQGPLSTGKIIVRDIGIPRKLLDRVK